ncbi:AMP-binding protein [Alicyclobacillus sp.]|uniref:class I adenylate-forming enzyme family protein n=1 Tax=Alicyclobacillus sp. TaxID=61169 RepID=UPI0025BD4140|nr:AMP-binding protein [Alicyclobacillus sp.]MCL6515328.1 AMP-binding protein [Alicyclobacillus sp.]
MMAAELIRRGALHFPKHTAVHFNGLTRTFEEVYQSSRRLANGLMRLGLRKGDRVAILLANSLESVEIDFALLLSGLVRVPLNTRLSVAEQRHMIRETEASAILYSAPFLARVEALRAQVPGVRVFGQFGGEAPDWAVHLDTYLKTVPDDEPGVRVGASDLATIQYTSGTTGTLKAAVHTQETWAAICNNILLSLDIREGDVMLHAAPLTHASGTLVLPHWVRGAANAVLPGFVPSAYLEAVEALRPTTLNLVPTMIVMLLNTPGVERYRFESVRNLLYGASPMPRQALARGLELWGPKFIQYYGQTEAPLILTVLSQAEHVADTETGQRRLLSCGRPAAHAEIRIVGEDGQELKTGEIGEIVVRTNQTMTGYWKAPELTAQTLRDGWIHTRDMGYFDPDGYLYLVDRRSDMIITGGFNVYPREVEDVLYQHEAVAEAAVVGVPDEKWVETIRAFVVLRPGRTATEAELVEFCKQRLASYKKPTSVVFVDDLPKSAVGKVVRRLLREGWGQVSTESAQMEERR